MDMRAGRRIVATAAAVLVAAGGAAWIAQADLARQRAAFETDARIAHRLLSQRAVQHEAILATLALLQPGGAEAPQQRLPALYPQVLRVVQRERDGAWSDAGFAEAEARSRTAKRAVLAALDAAAGRFALVQAAEPASYALVIDVQRMVPWSEWPLARDGAVAASLVLDGATLPLNPGAPAAAPVARFGFAKHLAAESQPFDLVVARSVGAASLPWAAMLAWCAAVAAAAVGLAAWQRQRSARRRAEELLRLGQVGRLNALGELAAGMAHELNQPLTALVASTQAAARLLQDDPPELDTARSAMDRAVQQARRAADVVARLRRVVQRPEAGSAPQRLSLADAARNVADLLAPEAARRGVALRVLAPVDALVQADPVAVEQIVHNLVMNGLQALEQVPAGERELVVEIGAGEGGQAQLAVRDSGPGIAPEALPRLFEPFFTTRSGGLGLGLSLCETLAQAMGGALAAANRVPRGAEFRLTLPKAPT
jgi:signal transduction histidine kinase